MTTNYTTAENLVGSWLADVIEGKPPIRFNVSEPFAALDVRPGRMILFGGAPGGGKTAAILQVGIDLVRMNPTARLLVANVEMAPEMLLERIVARLSGVPLTAITDRTLTPEQLDRVKIAARTLDTFAERLAFLRDPFSLEHVAAVGDEFHANVFAIDYIQRFTVGDTSADKREQLETAATVLRKLCHMGATVLLASAVSRQKNAGGSTYAGLTLASFRGSSELEFGTDSAYILTPNDGGGITLRCEKNRNGIVADIATIFDPTIQTFTPAPSGLDAFDAANPAATRTPKAKGDTPFAN